MTQTLVCLTAHNSQNVSYFLDSILCDICGVENDGIIFGVNASSMIFLLKALSLSCSRRFVMVVLYGASLFIGPRLRIMLYRT